MEQPVVASVPAASANQDGSWGSPPDCVLTKGGISLCLWSLPCSCGATSGTRGQDDMVSNDKVNLEEPVARYLGANSLPVRACVHHVSKS